MLAQFLHIHPPPQQPSYKTQLLHAYNRAISKQLQLTQQTILDAAHKFNTINTSTHSQKHSILNTHVYKSESQTGFSKNEKLEQSSVSEDQQRTALDYEVVLIQQKRLARMIEDTYAVLKEIESKQIKLQDFEESPKDRQQQYFRVEKQSKYYIVYTDKDSNIQKDFHSNSKPEQLFSRTCQLNHQRTQQQETFYKQLSQTYQNMPSENKQHIQTGINNKIKKRIQTSTSALPQTKYSRKYEQTIELAQRVRKQQKQRKDVIKTVSAAFK